MVGALAIGCGSKDDPAKGSNGPAARPAPAAAPSTPAPPAPAPSPPADPFANGFCEYTLDGGAPNKGGGGVMNVQSSHWMDDKYKHLAVPLLVNCGSSDKITIAAVDPLPRATGTFKLDTTNKPGTFGALGKDFLGANGEVAITAFDSSHVAGSFRFATKQGKKYEGRFDIKCPSEYQCK